MFHILYISILNFLAKVVIDLVQMLQIIEYASKTICLLKFSEARA